MVCDEQGEARDGAAVGVGARVRAHGAAQRPAQGGAAARARRHRQRAQHRVHEERHAQGTQRPVYKFHCAYL